MPARFAPGVAATHQAAARWQQVEVQELASVLPPRIKPLPVGYRPLNRQDALTSYWTLDSLWADSLFNLTAAYRS